MRNIRLAEITLAANGPMSFKEKLETARILDELRVDIIETCPVDAEKADEILVKTIAATAVNSAISCPVGEGGAQKAWDAVSGAKKPRLNVKMPVSVVQMEYMGHKKPAAMLAAIESAVKDACALCQDVAFTALDATRAEPEFLYSAIALALASGAKSVYVCDDTGETLPGEMGVFVKELFEAVPQLRGARLGVCVSDALCVAEACAFEAARAGANEICVRAAGAGAPGLTQMVNLFSARGDFAGAGCGVDTTSLKRGAARIASFLRARDKQTLNGQEDASPAAPGAALEKNADIAQVARAAKSLGYALTDEDMARVYDAFLHLAASKPVGGRELDAIIASVAMQVPPTYTLQSYVVNSGNILTATAHIVLDRGGERVQGLSTGDGPIDAALMAIEKIIGHHYELDDFQIQSVTAGREAMGEALVKLRDDGHLYSGRGISTDIVGAAIRAYLNALNKIVYREAAI